MKRKQKRTWGKLVLKVINNERKILMHQGIIDRIAEKIVGGHSSMQKIKIVDSSELKGAKFFIYFFKFTYFCIVHKWTLKKEFC